MLVRIITSVLWLIAILPCLIFSNTVLINILVALLCLISVFEMLRCTGFLKNRGVAVPAFLAAAIVPFATRFSYLFEEKTVVNSNVCLSVIMVFIFVVFTYTVFSKGKCDIVNSSFVTLILMYIVGGLSAIILIRDMPQGNVFYPLVFVAAWGTDIFAYFIGMLFGKHKLIPDVSPKKTVEGAVGGILGTTALFAVYGMLFLHLETIQYIVLIAFAPFVSVIAQVGDLLMSLIKRNYGIKDYGKLLPGHGGVLDRFDSIIAVSLFLCITCGTINLLV